MVGVPWDIRRLVTALLVVASVVGTTGTIATASATPTASATRVERDLRALSQAVSYETSLLRGGHFSRADSKLLAKVKAAAAAVTADQAKLDADLALTAATTTPGPKPLVTFTGNGSENLPGFTVPSTAKSWGLDWWVSACQGFSFDVVINGSTEAGDVGPSPVGPNDQKSAHGSDVYTDTGSFEFQVISNCYWTLKVYD